MNKSYNKNEVWKKFTDKMTVESIIDDKKHLAVF